MLRHDGATPAVTLRSRVLRLLPASDLPSPPAFGNPWWWAALLAGALVTAMIGLFLASMPLQLSDNLGNILQVQGVAWAEVFNILNPALYHRPMLWVTLKFFLDQSHGHYFLTFKALHIAMVGGLLLLCLRLMQVRNATDFAAAAICFYFIVGMHSFTGLVNEGYPINNHLTPVLAAVAVANMAFSRGGIIVDLGAVLLFVFTVLTVETGLLIPVVLVSAYFLGWRGVSMPAIGVIIGLSVGVLFFRLGATGSAAGLVNIASGFGFSRLTGADVAERFGDQIYIWFLYNVASSFLSVLFAEPRAGLWSFIQALLTDRLRAHHIVEVGSSVLLTGLIALYAWRRARHWLTRELTHGDRLLLLAFPVAAANAAISFAYTKDQIIATAGVFWALAGFVAIGDVLHRLSDGRMSGFRGLAAGVAVLLVAAGFVIRTGSTHFSMYRNALNTQAEWILRLDEQYFAMAKTPAAEALIWQLRSDALNRSMPSRYFVPRWLLEYENK